MTHEVTGKREVYEQTEKRIANICFDVQISNAKAKTQTQEWEDTCMEASTAAGRKLPARVKWMFASGDFGKTLLVVMTMGFSLYFYTNVLGMDPNVVSIIILIAKIWDFINDPMMGALVDKTRSKEGKYRMWLKYMSVPGGVCLALCFMMPNLVSTGKIVWVAVTYTLQGMASTALMIPMNTLMSRITVDPTERAQLNACRGYFSLAANLFASAITVPFVMAAGNGDMQKGFLIFGILCGVLYAFSNLIVFWGTKGYEPIEEEVPKAADKTEFRETVSIGQVFSNIPWLFILLAYFVINIAVSIAGSTQMFYCQYNLGDVNLYSIISTISMLACLPVYLVMGKLVKKFGNVKCAIMGTAIAAAGYFLRVILHDANLVVVLTGTIIGCVGQILASSMVILIIYDSYIYMEYKTGKAAPEGILVSGYSVAYKVGMAIASPVAGWLLGSVPYVAGAETQESSVLNLFYYENTLLPAIAFTVACFFSILLIGFAKKLPGYKAELAKKKGLA